MSNTTKLALEVSLKCSSAVKQEVESCASEKDFPPTALLRAFLIVSFSFLASLPTSENCAEMLFFFSNSQVSFMTSEQPEQ